MKNCRLLQDFLLPALRKKTFGDLLKWDPTDAGVFLLRWVHKSKSCWSANDAKVFLEWDRMKGRPVAKTHSEFVNAKQRLRAALRNIKTVEEIPTDGEEKCFRKYRILGMEGMPQPKIESEPPEKKLEISDVKPKSGVTAISNSNASKKVGKSESVQAETRGGGIQPFCEEDYFENRFVFRSLRNKKRITYYESDPEDEMSNCTLEENFEQESPRKTQCVKLPKKDDPKRRARTPSKRSKRNTSKGRNKIKTENQNASVQSVPNGNKMAESNGVGSEERYRRPENENSAPNGYNKGISEDEDVHIQNTCQIQANAKPLKLEFENLKNCRPFSCENYGAGSTAKNFEKSNVYDVILPGKESQMHSKDATSEFESRRDYGNYVTDFERKRNLIAVNVPGNLYIKTVFHDDYQNNMVADWQAVNMQNQMVYALHVPGYNGDMNRKVTRPNFANGAACHRPEHVMANTGILRGLNANNSFRNLHQPTTRYISFQNDVGNTATLAEADSIADEMVVVEVDEKYAHLPWTFARHGHRYEIPPVTENLPDRIFESDSEENSAEYVDAVNKAYFSRAVDEYIRYCLPKSLLVEDGRLLQSESTEVSDVSEAQLANGTPLDVSIVTEKELEDIILTGSCSRTELPQEVEFEIIAEYIGCNDSNPKPETNQNFVSGSERNLEGFSGAFQDIKSEVVEVEDGFAIIDDKYYEKLMELDFEQFFKSPPFQ